MASEHTFQMVHYRIPVTMHHICTASRSQVEGRTGRVFRLLRTTFRRGCRSRPTPTAMPTSSTRRTTRATGATTTTRLSSHRLRHLAAARHLEVRLPRQHRQVRHIEEDRVARRQHLEMQLHRRVRRPPRSQHRRPVSHPNSNLPQGRRQHNRCPVQATQRPRHQPRSSPTVRQDPS